MYVILAYVGIITQIIFCLIDSNTNGLSFFLLIQTQMV